MSSLAAFKTGSLLCGNCCKQLEKDSSTRAIKIKNVSSVSHSEIQIFDALAYIYGISWDEFQTSRAQENISSEEEWSVNFCTTCAIILSNNYYFHTKLERASDPSSIVHRINIFRERNWKSVTNPQFGDTNCKSPSESPNHQQGNEITSELSDSVDLDDSEDHYENNSTDIECEPEYNLEELPRSEPEIKKKSPNPDCSKIKLKQSASTNHLKFVELSVNLERISAKNLAKFIRTKDNTVKAKKYIVKGKSSQKKHSRKKEPFVPNCRICGKVLASRKSMRIHLVVMHGDEEEQQQRKMPCEICGKVLTGSNSMKGHLELHADPTYSCDICGKTFHQKRALRQHILIHTERQRSFLCGQCGKAFTSKPILARHEETHIEGLLPKFPCDICSKLFTKKIYMMTHRRSTHSTERKYICDECGKSFKFRYQMVTHKKLHEEMAENSGEPIQCDECGKELKHSYRLLQHKRRKHPQGEKKIYQCSICDKILSCGKSLRNHKKVVHKIFQDAKLGNSN